jgi:Sec-independent protein translocase protein TatA
MRAMGDGAWVPWVVIVAVAVVLFLYRGAIRRLLDDAAKGIRAFRDRL